MITCEVCRRTVGDGEVGDHWICRDCKADPERTQDYEEKDKAKREGS